MNSFNLTDLAKIIERESKDSTYKFALLRGTIDLIQNYPNQKDVRLDLRVHFPMGLLVLQWVEYYFPLFSMGKDIPQRHGTQPIAFRKELKEVIDLYSAGDTKYSSLQSDLRRGIEDSGKIKAIMKLLRKLRATIADKPMYHIGSSIEAKGKIYIYESTRPKNPEVLTLDWIIRNMGTFSVPVGFYDVLSTIGTFISGTNSIIFKWAEFTAGLVEDDSIRSSEIIELLSDKETARDVEQSKGFFSDILKQQEVMCVWSGKKVKQEHMHIDHLLPYAAIHNNDLWNLLPAREKVNLDKSDSIPTPDLLERRIVKDRIVSYWEMVCGEWEEQFLREIRISLLGKERMDRENWQNSAYGGLVNLSNHLINNRGLNPWKYTG